MILGRLFELEGKTTRVSTTSRALPFKRVRNGYWDFRDTPASTGVYGIHPYPAMFHFLVVKQLIHDYSREDELIFDPFMGTGVVAVESLINNRNFAGCDINPLAVLIAEVRTTPIPRRQLLETFYAVEQEYSRNCPETIEFHNIHYWFDEDVIEQLSRLRKSIFGIENRKIRNFFQVVFSETVRRVSKTRYNEFKLLRRKGDSISPEVSKTFRDVSIRNIRLVSDFYTKYPENRKKIIIENRNMMEAALLQDRSADLVVTSPPYGDSRTTVAYGQFSRLSLRWLGIEENVDRTSLGGRPRSISYDLPSQILYEVLERIVNKDGKRAKEVFSFYKDLFDSVKIIASKVKANGYVCFVVGNRRVKSEELPTDKISADFFESIGFQHEKTIVRAISSKRMPAKNAPSNIRGQKGSTMRYEYIVVLRNNG